MNHPEEGRLSPDLQDIEERLRRERTEASALELDRIKRQAMARSSGRSQAHRQKGFTMKRPSSLTALLLAGVIVFGGGAALAQIGGFGGGSTPTGSAARAQYPDACAQLVRQNRSEEAALRRENRAEERAAGPGRRSAVVRRNRAEESELRRQNRAEERACRDARRSRCQGLRAQNRAEERAAAPGQRAAIVRANRAEERRAGC